MYDESCVEHPIQTSTVAQNNSINTKIHLPVVAERTNCWDGGW